MVLGGDEGSLLGLRIFAFALTGEGLFGRGLEDETGVLALAVNNFSFAGGPHRFNAIAARGTSESDESELNESFRFRLNPRLINAGMGDPISTEPSFEGDLKGVKPLAYFQRSSGDESSAKTSSTFFSFSLPL